MHTISPVVVIASLLLLLCSLPAAAFQQEIVLEEALGRAWSEDLVHHTFWVVPGETVPPGMEVKPASLSLFRDGKPVPMQIVNAATEKKGNLLMADVWFRADMPAGSRQTFVLKPGRKAKVLNGVTVHKHENSIELDNGLTAVRIPVGHWNPGAPLPAPVAGIRLPDGKWTGAASLQPQGDFSFPPLPGLMQPVGPKEPIGRMDTLDAQVLANGPLLAQVHLQYGGPRSGTYSLTISLRAGEPMVRFDERYQDAGAVTFTFNGVKPTAAGYQSNGGPAGGRSIPIAYDKPSLVGMFTGWNLFFQQISACYSLTGDPNGNVLGLVSTDPDWLPFPYNQGMMLNTEGDHLVLRGPLDDGHRHWALYVGKKDAPQSADTMAFYRWWYQHIVFALDKVVNWQLTWPGMDDIAFPHVFFNKDDIAAIRQRLRAEPAIVDYMQRLKPRTDTETAAAYLYTGDPAVLEQLATKNDPRLYIDKAVKVNLDDAGFFVNANLYNPMQVTDEILQRLVGLELLLGSGRLTKDERHAALTKIAFLVYLMHDPMWIPPNYAYEPDKPVPYPGYVQGTPNQKHCYFSVRAMLAMALTNHPEKAKWMQYAVDENERCTPASIAESGVHLESPFYSARDTMRYGPFWTAMGRAGVDRAVYNKWFSREKMTYQYMADMLTPPEPRMNGRRVYHPLGRSSSGVIDPTFMIGNEPWGQGDPAHGALMRKCWEQQGKPTFDGMGTTGGRDLSLTLLAFSTLPPTSAGAPPLRSRRWEGFGAIFRSQVDSGFESNVLFRQDAFAWNLYEQNNGAVYFYGKGAPLLPRFGGYWMGQQGQPHLMSVPFGNRLYFADGMQEQDWKNGLGTMTACATLGNLADYAAGVTLDKAWTRGVLFAKDLDHDDPVYLLVRDDVSRMDVPSAVHWWVLSKDVQPDGFEKPGVISTKGHDETWLAKMGQNWPNAPALKGQLQHFAGQCGVDVDLFIAVPADPKIVVDAVGVGPNESYNVNPKMYEYQELVRIEQPAGKSYLTLITPRWPGSTAPQYRTIADGCGVAITSAGRDDRLFLAPKPTAYTDDLVRFNARAGMARVGGAVSLRLLVVDGTISAKGVTLVSPTPAALVYDGKSITVRCGKDAKVDITLEGAIQGTPIKYERE
jgi:hypothetical protein